MGNYNPGVARFNQYREVHGDEVCPGVGACAMHSVAEAFEWPEDTGMDERDQNLDGVVRDPDVVTAPVALWPSAQQLVGNVVMPVNAPVMSEAS